MTTKITIATSPPPRFKNKKIKIKRIESSSKGDVTINGKPFLKFREFTEKE